MNSELYQNLYLSAPYVGAPGEAGLPILLTLVEVLMRIPESIREFALRRCVFTSLPPALRAVTWEATLAEQAMADPRKFYLIIVSEFWLNIAKSMEARNSGRTKTDLIDSIRRVKEKLRHLFAHEIAHAYIKDTYEVPPEDVEAEANILASEWGFSVPKESKGQ